MTVQCGLFPDSAKNLLSQAKPFIDKNKYGELFSAVQAQNLDKKTSDRGIYKIIRAIKFSKIAQHPELVEIIQLAIFEDKNTIESTKLHNCIINKLSKSLVRKDHLATILCLKIISKLPPKKLCKRLKKNCDERMLTVIDSFLDLVRGKAKVSITNKTIASVVIFTPTITALIKVIKFLRNIGFGTVKLDLSDNKSGKFLDGDLIRLLNVIHKDSDLFSNLSLKGQNISKNSMGRLVKLLTANRTIKKLSLEYCSMEATQINQISRLMFQRKCKLENINLSNNPQIGKALSIFFDCIPSETPLKTINLRNTHISAETIAKIGVFFLEKKTHCAIKLSPNELNDQDKLYLEKMSDKSKKIIYSTKNEPFPFGPYELYQCPIIYDPGPHKYHFATRKDLDIFKAAFEVDAFNCSSQEISTHDSFSIMLNIRDIPPRQLRFLIGEHLIMVIGYQLNPCNLAEKYSYYSYTKYIHHKIFKRNSLQLETIPESQDLSIKIDYEN